MPPLRATSWCKPARAAGGAGGWARPDSGLASLKFAVIVGRPLTTARLRPRSGEAPTHSGSMRPTRGFNLEGENETAVVGEAVPVGQVSAAAAEAANQPILGHVRGANNRWIPEQPHGSSELGKEGAPRSRCDSLASWARRCVGRDAEGRLVIGCGGVTLPAMVTLHANLSPNPKPKPSPKPNPEPNPEAIPKPNSEPNPSLKPHPNLHQVALHRLVVCALAVGLLWATSLSNPYPSPNSTFNPRPDP